MCFYNSNKQGTVDKAYKMQQNGVRLIDSAAIKGAVNGKGGGISGRDITFGETSAGVKANTPATGSAALTPGVESQRQPSLLGSSPGQANTAAATNRRRGLGRAGMGSTDEALGTTTLLGG